MIRTEFSPLFSPDESGGCVQPNPEARNPQEIIIDWEGYSKEIQNALRRVGLFNPEAFTPARLQDFGTAILRQLTPFTAESLYFDAYRSSLRERPRENVTAGLLIAHAQYHQSYGMDLEKLQLIQRSQDLGLLYEAHIDGDQVLRLASGTPGMQQSINRLSFFLFDTPDLVMFKEQLKNETPEDSSNSIEEVIIEAQHILDERVAVLAAAKLANDQETDSEKKWTPFRIASYVRIMNRTLARHKLGDIILEEVRSTKTTLSDLMGEDEPFEP